MIHWTHLDSLGHFPSPAQLPGSGPQLWLTSGQRDYVQFVNKYSKYLLCFFVFFTSVFTTSFSFLTKTIKMFTVT